MKGWNEVASVRRQSQANEIEKSWKDKGFTVKITTRRLGIAYLYRIWVKD